ncbi:MAG: glycosyltransferase family 39 protein [Opitutaceae bacterium]|nr:glycosyltransferase family 39 protein [Opitutaceae bacterium]
MSAALTPSYRRDLLLLTLLFGLLFGFRLGSYPLANPDEGRYAEIPREMAATGDYITPRLNGVPYFEKPPLMYWLGAISIRCFGSSEWVMRAWPALFGLAGVLATYGTTRRLYGRDAGWWAAVVLGTSLLWFGLSRLLLLDMAVSFFIAGTLFAFIAALQEPPGRRRRLLFYALYACAACATLTKGLIGFMLPGAVIFLWLLLLNQWSRLRPLYLPTGLVLFLAIAAPWHVLASLANHSAVKEQDFAWFYFVHEHFLRFTTTIHGRHQPWWFFVPILIFGLFPWVVFLPQALRQMLAGGWAARRERAPAWFFVFWAAFIFLFFSKSSSKLIPYILPVFPAVAALLGTFLARTFAEGERKALRVGVILFTVLCCLIVIAAWVALSGRPEPQRLALLPYFSLLLLVLVAGSAATLLVHARRGPHFAISQIALTAAAFSASMTYVIPEAQRASTKPLAEIYRPLAHPGDRLFQYRGFFHDFTFYTGRTVDLVDYHDELEVQFLTPAERAARFIDEAEFRRRWAEPVPAYALGKKQDLAALFADKAFRYRLLGETREHCFFSNQSAAP